MSDFKQRLHHFIEEHRAHCSLHPAYTKDCQACINANDGGFELTWGNNPSQLDNSTQFDVNSATTDTGPSTADFSGFDGGNSGGGGASGDF